MRTVKIVMLSGGYDSTGVLFWALRHPDWHIIAHHVELVNSEKRHDLENAAVKKIIEYCGDKLEFSSSRFENSDPYFFEKDIVNVGFIAAIKAKSAHIKYRELDRESPCVEVFTGGTLEDHCDDQIESMDGIGIKNKVFEAMFSGWDRPGDVPTISIPFKNIPKIEVVKYIPKEILPHIWTCRVPTRRSGTFIECGECVACYRKKLISEAA